MDKPLFLEPQQAVREEPQINWFPEEDEPDYEGEMWNALVRLSEYYDLEPKKTQRPHRKNFYRKSQ